MCNSGSQTEIFLVEGASAAGAIKRVRDRSTQYVHAINGKVPNAGKVSTNALSANPAVQSLLNTLYPASAVEAECLYDRVIIACDGDPDGRHASALLMKLFQVLMPGLVAAGNVYNCIPPLYVNCFHGSGSKDTILCYSREQQLALQAQTDVPIGMVCSTTYMKGLASMDADLLHSSCVNAASRKIRQLALPVE